MIQVNGVKISWFIHKHEVHLEYGGPEEGDWWFDVGVPVEDFEVMGFVTEEEAYAKCRELNGEEYDRRKREEDYDYSSVLSYKSQHFAYTVEDFPIPVAYPQERPHYE